MIKYFLIIITFFVTLVNAQIPITHYQYPQVSGYTMSKGIIPEKTLNRMTAEALFWAVLEYPYQIDWYALSGSKEDNLQTFAKGCTALKEIMERFQSNPDILETGKNVLTEAQQQNQEGTEILQEILSALEE